MARHNAGKATIATARGHDREQTAPTWTHPPARETARNPGTPTAGTRPHHLPPVRATRQRRSNRQGRIIGMGPPGTRVGRPSTRGIDHEPCACAPSLQPRTRRYAAKRVVETHSDRQTCEQAMALTVANADSKRCVNCRVTKPVTEFSQDQRRRDNLKAQCRTCDRARLRAAYEQQHPHCRPYRPQRGGLCDVEGCQDRHKARGFCRKHYLRVLKHGSPEPTTPL